MVYKYAAKPFVQTIFETHTMGADFNGKVQDASQRCVCLEFSCICHRLSNLQWQGFRFPLGRYSRYRLSAWPKRWPIASKRLPSWFSVTRWYAQPGRHRAIPHVHMPALRLFCCRPAPQSFAANFRLLASLKAFFMPLIRIRYIS